MPLPRLTVALFLAALAGTCLDVSNGVAAETCATGDSAICAASPDCHWDFVRRGCEPGAPKWEDPCAVHGDSQICNADRALGCKWNAEKRACGSAG